MLKASVEATLPTPVPVIFINYASAAVSADIGVSLSDGSAEEAFALNSYL